MSSSRCGADRNYITLYNTIKHYMELTGHYKTKKTLYRTLQNTTEYYRTLQNPTEN